jgi:hypothetical protein
MQLISWHGWCCLEANTSQEFKCMQECNTTCWPLFSAQQDVVQIPCFCLWWSHIKSITWHSMKVLIASIAMKLHTVSKRQCSDICTHDSQSKPIQRWGSRIDNSWKIPARDITCILMSLDCCQTKQQGIAQIAAHTLYCRRMSHATCLTTFKHSC